MDATWQRGTKRGLALCLCDSALVKSWILGLLEPGTGVPPLEGNKGCLGAQAPTAGTLTLPDLLGLSCLAGQLGLAGEASLSCCILSPGIPPRHCANELPAVLCTRWQDAFPLRDEAIAGQ